MFLFGMVMLEVGFNVILVIIGWFELILFKMLFVWFDKKFFGVILLWCWLFFCLIIIKLLLILIVFIVLMDIKVWVKLVFRWLNMGLFKLIGIFLVIIVSFVLIELFFFLSLWMSLLNCLIVIGFG